MYSNIHLSVGSLNKECLHDRTNHPSLGILSAYIVGDILGTVDSSGLINRDSNAARKHIFDLIRDSEDFSKISLMPFVGSFSIIIILHDKVELYSIVSCTSPTPYIFIKDGTVFVEFDENKLLQDYAYKFSSQSILNISLSHQLVVRYPTQLFDLASLLRCPCGHITRISDGFSRVNYLCFLNNYSLEFTSSRLRNSLSSILTLYSRHYKGNLGLLFSGGLDSSCLASSLASSNIQLPYYHIDYKGDVSYRSSVAASISSFFGSPTSHIPRFSTSVDVPEILRQCKAGLMTVPNPMYFGVPINASSVKNLPKYLITGQGADSIYVIDGFAPPTESIGKHRVNQIISSAPDRLALCESYILEQLQYNETDIDSSILSSPIFVDFVNKQCCDLLEHVDYKVYAPFMNSNSISSERMKHIAKPVLALLRSYIKTSSNNVSITSVYRYIKWMRSLINCPQQDASALLSQSVQRLTPYLEGPIVGLFFGYKLREIESLSIKHELESLFHYHADESHRRLVEIAVSQTPSHTTCGQKLFSSASNKDINRIQSEALRSLAEDLKTSSRAQSLSPHIKDATQLVRIAPFL